jgi:ribosome-binding factor A
MSGRRLERLSSQLVREVSDILRRRVSDPRVSWVTVTRAKISPDLSQAKIYVSTLETGEKRGQMLEALKHAAGFIRHELGSRLQLRLTPEVRFFLDEEFERAEHVVELLQGLHKEGEV